VLILRDVLGFTGAEVAEAMDTTTTPVYSLLQRAHATIDERLPERSQMQASASGQPAVGAYRLEDSGRFEFHHLMVVTLRGRKIDELNAFHDPDPALFGLPATA